MRILTKYILREVTAHTLIGVAVFTFVIFMRDLGKILELVVRNSASLPNVVEVFAFTLPTALALTLPMGVLVGMLTGLSRLAADSEITAMRSSGMGVWDFTRILSVFIAAAWLVGMLNNAFLAPRSAAALSRLQDQLKTSQVSYEIQPRVFYEDFPNAVVYVQDVASTQRAATWRGVFLADVSKQGSPNITLAREGIVDGEQADHLQVHLTNGSTHETDPKKPDQNITSTFGQRDILIPIPPAAAQQKSVAATASETPTLWLPAVARQQKDPADTRTYLIEFHRRLALAAACIVLAMVGIPLGLSSKKGGKSTGFVLTITLVLLYYIISLFGISFARQGKMPPAAGIWMANVLFFLGGLFLLYRVDRMPIHIPTWRDSWSRLRQFIREHVTSNISNARDAFERASHRPRLKNTRFPMILDDLILRSFLVNLGMILLSFLVLMLVFTFFELLRDIVRNKVSLLLVGEYLVNLIPFLLYNVLPLSVLLAVLITFGLMQKSSEITAMKATGISVYRIVSPVLVLAAVIACGLFLFDQFYLPQANKRQDALRDQIKGKAAQTYLRPDRKWIFGERSNIYYYEFFDPDQSRFASIQAFEFDPHTFELTRRIYATRAHWSDSLNRWVFEQGWVRSFRGTAILEYRTFDVATFPELDEPPTYFRKEVKQSQQMNYAELRRYIHELQQSGFDVVRLRVQLQKKLAFPLITFVMAVLAIPFSLTTGRRGTLAGVATAIGIAIMYFIASGLFENLGNFSQLPPLLAAWAPDMIFALAGGYMILKVPT
jgi:LPS export ABC transporter permease LptG/LPS export ABC transporter permease LptF